MRYPKIIEFELTTACNYSCKHCYCNAGKKSTNELSFDEVKKVLHDLKDANVEIVDLIGGEPLIRQDIVDIISYAASIGLDVMLILMLHLQAKKLSKGLRKFIHS